MPRTACNAIPPESPGARAVRQTGFARLIEAGAHSKPLHVSLGKSPYRIRAGVKDCQLA